MLERVTELKTEPTVGKFYLVLCVLELGTHTGWRPILGPVHGDAEVGVPQHHWHYDHRFTSEAQLDEIGASDLHRPGLTRMETAFAFVASTNRVISGPDWRRRKCRRVMGRFPLVSIVTKLERLYADKQMVCFRCPHRNFDLSSMPVKHGRVICPGHGLMFDIQTGGLVPRR